MIYTTRMVAVISFLTVLRMMSDAQTTCNRGIGRLMYEKISNTELQGLVDDTVRERAPPMQVLQRCRHLCLQDTNSQNLRRTCSSFVFVPGRRIGSRGPPGVSPPRAPFPSGNPFSPAGPPGMPPFPGSTVSEYEESTCLMSHEAGQPDGGGILAVVRNRVLFNEICLSSSRVNTQCPERIYAFERVQGYRLDIRDGQDVYVKNKTECEDRCLNEFNFVCRSASYDRVTQKCTLARKTRRTSPSSLVRDPNSEYLENTCLDGRQRCEGGTPVFIKMVGVTVDWPYNFEEVDTPTLEDCQRRCLDHRNLFCRSIMYNKRRRMCIPSDEDSTSEPEFFIPGMQNMPGLPPPPQSPGPQGNGIFGPQQEQQDMEYYEVMCLNIPMGPGMMRGMTPLECMRGQRISSNLAQDEPAQSKDDCIVRCLRKGPACRSCDFSHSTGVCRLSQASKYTGASLISDPQFDHYEVDPTGLTGSATNNVPIGPINTSYGITGGSPYYPGPGGSPTYSNMIPSPHGSPPHGYPIASGYPPGVPPGMPGYPPPAPIPGYPGPMPPPPPTYGGYPPPPPPPPYGGAGSYGGGGMYGAGGYGTSLAHAYNPYNAYKSVSPPVMPYTPQYPMPPMLPDRMGYGKYPSPQMPGYPGPQMPGYPPQMPGYPPQMPGYPGMQPGYPGMRPSYPGMQPGMPGQGTDQYKLAQAKTRIRFFYVRRTVSAPSLEECQKQCSESRDFFCRSFNYRETFPDNCELSDQDTSTLDVNNNAYFDHNTQFDYYERKSAASPAPSPQTGYPPYPPMMPGPMMPGPMMPGPMMPGPPMIPGPMMPGPMMPGSYPSYPAPPGPPYPPPPGPVGPVGPYPGGPAPPFPPGGGGFPPYRGPLDVSQQCTEDGIEFTLRTPEGFFGRIYTWGFFDSCFFDGQGSTVSVLRIARAHGMPRCGMLEFGDYFTNIVVVQFNDYVQTSRDRMFNVTCTLYGPGETLVSSGVMGTGNVPIPIDYLPAQNILSSNVMLKIMYHGHPVQQLAVGDPITFKLEARRGYGFAGDIFATNVVAKDPYSGRTVPLIDAYGCPIDLFIFPPLDRARAGDGLEANFAAFKIPDANFMVFEATVRTCRGPCPPVQCNTNGRFGLLSFGRKRRDVNETQALHADPNRPPGVAIPMNPDEGNVIPPSNPGMQMPENAPRPEQPNAAEDNQKPPNELYPRLQTEPILPTAEPPPMMDNGNASNPEEYSEVLETVHEMFKVFNSRQEMYTDSYGVKMDEVCIAPEEYYGLIASMTIIIIILLAVTAASAFFLRRYRLLYLKNKNANLTSPISGRPALTSDYFADSRYTTRPRGFEDPSEPIYTDPSLFERSRSLRSAETAMAGRNVTKRQEAV